MPNNGDANATYSGLTSFDSDGFTLGTMADMNTNTENFISWNWKAGTTTGKSTTDETITPTDYSLNTAAGISIIRYTGTGTTGYINHGLGVKPNAVIIKQTDSGETGDVSSQVLPRQVMVLDLIVLMAQEALVGIVILLQTQFK